MLELLLVTTAITMATVKNSMLIDFHTHHLHGIDDGAKSIEDSLNQLTFQKNSGIDAVVVTPHFKYRDRNDLEKFLEIRQQQVGKLFSHDLPLNVYIGAEVYYTVDLMDIDLSQLTINQTDYLLIEFSTRMKPSNLVDSMDELISQGYRVIIAHIERYPFFREEPQLLNKLGDLGVLFQINASTIIDEQDKDFVGACFKKNLVHFIASDAHNLDTRKPNLVKAYEIIERQYGNEYVNYLQSNVSSVLSNQEIVTRKSKSIKKLFGRFM